MAAWHRPNSSLHSRGRSTGDAPHCRCPHPLLATRVRARDRRQSRRVVTMWIVDVVVGALLGSMVAAAVGWAGWSRSVYRVIRHTAAVERRR